PSASGGLVAYQATGGAGVLVRGEEKLALPGLHPAVSGGLVARLADGRVVIADATTLAPLLSLPAPGANALALSQRYVAWRAPGRGGRDALYARALTTPAASEPIRVATSHRSGSLGRPALDGSRVVFDDQSPGVSRILQRDAATGAARTLRRSASALLLQPSTVARRLLYVRSTFRRQKVILGGRVVYSTTPTARRDGGEEAGHQEHHAGYPRGRRPKAPPRPAAGLTVTLWTTAFDGDAAYVTRLRHRRGGRTQATILKINR
ncbi:MAG: hypothetical protein ACR2NB_07985, partial [Solirubrobacteraceae bacterium]